MCFPVVVISFGVESSLNSRILSFSPGIRSSSRNDSDVPLSTSSVAPLVLGTNRLVAAVVNLKAVEVVVTAGEVDDGLLAVW